MYDEGQHARTLCTQFWYTKEYFWSPTTNWKQKADPKKWDRWSIHGMREATQFEPNSFTVIGSIFSMTHTEDCVWYIRVLCKFTALSMASPNCMSLSEINVHKSSPLKPSFRLNLTRSTNTLYFISLMKITWTSHLKGIKSVFMVRRISREPEVLNGCIIFLIGSFCWRFSSNNYSGQIYALYLYLFRTLLHNNRHPPLNSAPIVHFVSLLFRKPFHKIWSTSICLLPCPTNDWSFHFTIFKQSLYSAKAVRFNWIKWLFQNRRSMSGSI